MNQRARSRRDTIFHTNVRDTETGETLGRVINISQDGLAIARQDALADGRVLDVVMELPYRIEGRNELRFRAQVRWSAASADPEQTQTRVGLFILDDDETRRQIFEELRMSCCFNR